MKTVKDFPVGALVKPQYGSQGCPEPDYLAVERWRVFVHVWNPFSARFTLVLVEDGPYTVFRDQLFPGTKAMIWPEANLEMLEIVT